MSNSNILHIKPIAARKAPCKCASKVCDNSITTNKIENIRFHKFKKLTNRDYVGKYCLVDWLDDSAVIDCSLIHEWD